MRKYISIFVVALSAWILMSCTPTPAELAEESRELHRQLEAAKTEQDSSRIFAEIARLETQARTVFDKTELREYERLAHPAE